MFRRFFGGGKGRDDDPQDDTWTTGGSWTGSAHVADEFFEMLDHLDQQASSGEAAFALTRLNELIEAQGPSAEVLISRSNAYIMLERPEAAEASASQAIDLAPEHPMAHNNRGYARMQQGRYREAIADFERAIQLDPMESMALQNLAFAYAEIGEMDAAQAAGAKPAAKLTDNPLLIARLVALLNMERGLHAGLKVIDDVLRRQSGNSYLMLIRHQMLVFYECPEEAASQLERIRGVDSTGLVTALAKATLGVHQASFDEAANELAHAKELIDKYLSGTRDHDLWTIQHDKLELGVIYGRNEVEEVLAKAMASLQESPNSRAAADHAIRVHVAAGRHEDVRGSVSRMREAYPACPFMRCHQALFTGLDGDNAAAFDACLEVLAEYPRLAAAIMGALNHGTCAGRYQEVLEVADRFVETTRHGPVALQAKVIALARLERFEEARAIAPRMLREAKPKWSDFGAHPSLASVMYAFAAQSLIPGPDAEASARIAQELLRIEQQHSPALVSQRAILGGMTAIQP